MAEVYDTPRFAELYYASRAPTIEHLGLAAKYVTELLTSSCIPFVIIGGWAIYLRGGGRQTLDVDIAVGTTMEYLKNMLLAQPRIFFPKNHGQTSVQIFVKTGQDYDQGYRDTANMNVSLDLVIAGNLGIPVDIDASRDQIFPAVATPQGNSVPVLGIYHQLHAKLTAFASRGDNSNNDFQDLVFLISTYGTQLSSYKGYLDNNHCRAFAAKYASVYEGYDDAIKYVRAVLGVE